MKTKNLLLNVLAVSACVCAGRPLPTLAAALSGQQQSNAAVAGGGYTVVARGANHNTVGRLSWHTNRLGAVTVRTNIAYTELASGMNHFRDGVWRASSDRLGVLADQSAAVLENAAYQATLPADLYNSFLTTVTPDGHRLRSRPLGVSYSDGTNSVLIAELKECTGELLPSGNQVIWRDAFTNIEADVLASCSRAGLQCDLIIRSPLPAPESFNLGRDCRVQLLTEFFEGEPQIRAQSAVSAAPAGSTVLQARPAAQTALRDHTLSFGQVMRMGPGKAFRIGPGNPGTNTFRVFKSWNVLEGRKFLIEELPLSAIQAELDQLQASASRTAASHFAASVSGAKAKPRAGKLELPAARATRPGAKAMTLARSDAAARDGFVIDYDLVGTVGDFTLTNSQTYFVSDRFEVGGVLTLCGGAVIKLTNYTPARISFSGPLAIDADFYHPVVFTSMSDDSIGEPLPGSSHVPELAGGACLEDWSNAGNTYRHLRFRYADCAVSIPYQNDYPHEIWHCQFLACRTALAPVGTLRCYNTLFSKCDKAIWGCEAFEVTQSTFDQCGTLAAAPWPFSTATLLNSILTEVTNVDSAITRSSCLEAASGEGIYQAAVAGAYYLAPGGASQVSAATNIHPVLRSDLRRLTTEPPVVNYESLFAVDTTLAPQAQRDFSASIIGYHYAPLDFLLCRAWLTNATLRVLPGTAIGTFGADGLTLRSNARLVCEGRADNPIRIARYNLVQENSITNWDGKGCSLAGNYPGDASTELVFRFTDWSMPGVDGEQFEASAGSTVAGTFRDCRFQGGRFEFADPALTLSNCLFEGASVWLGDNSAMSPVFQNCLFAGGSLVLEPFEGGSWTFRDNLFSGPIIQQTPQTQVDASHNGYTPGTARLFPNSPTDTITNVVFQLGSLGAYYLPTNSPFIDAGSVLASEAGLYHHTTQVEQRKEAGSTNDLSFHYVAVTSSVPETVWVDDLYPAGSGTWGDDDNWYWSTNPAPAAPSLCHTSSIFAGMHQHGCYNWPQTYAVGVDDTLFCYLRLDPPDLPTEVMVQWLAEDGTEWNHRAFWGADNIPDWGPRTYLGPLPATNGWVRLEIPARLVDLAGRTVSGMAFTLYDGTAAWDYAGLLAGGGMRTPCDQDQDGLADCWEDCNGDGNGNNDPTSWQTYNSANGLTGNAPLQVFTPLK